MTSSTQLTLVAMLFSAFAAGAQSQAAPPKKAAEPLVRQQSVVLEISRVGIRQPEMALDIAGPRKAARFRVAARLGVIEQQLEIDSVPDMVQTTLASTVLAGAGPALPISLQLERCVKRDNLLMCTPLADCRYRYDVATGAITRYDPIARRLDGAAGKGTQICSGFWAERGGKNNKVGEIAFTVRPSERAEPAVQ